MPTDGAKLATSRRSRVRRAPLLLVIAVLVGAYIVVSFGRTLATLNEVGDRAAELRAETALLETRLEQGRLEMELAQTPAFQRLLARSHGMGPPGELAFALEAGAPPPPVVVPLGGDGNAGAGTPLDAWLGLLFGD